MRKFRVWKRIVAGLIVAIVLIVAAAAVYVFWLKPRVIIPDNLKGAVPYSAMYPTSKSGVTVNMDSAKYFSDEKMMVFEGEYNTARSRLVFSQQALPEELKNEGSFKDLIESMAPYSSFNSRFGPVSLTLPPSQGERQSAVMKTSDSLVFILAAENLTEEQWRVLIDSLVLVENN